VEKPRSLHSDDEKPVLEKPEPVAEKPVPAAEKPEPPVEKGHHSSSSDGEYPEPDVEEETKAP